MRNQKMDRARFEALAEAYGGDVTRWPEDERDAALKLLGEQPAMARTVLAAAMRLDTVLDAHRAPLPNASLRGHILAAAPGAKRPAPWRKWLTGAGVGLTLASACAAGVAFGVAAAQPSADDRRADAVLNDAGFDAGGDLAAADRT